MFGMFGQSILEEAMAALVEKRSNGALKTLENLRQKISEQGPFVKIGEAFFESLKVGDMFTTDTNILIRISKIHDNQNIATDWWNTSGSNNGPWCATCEGAHPWELVSYKRCYVDPANGSSG